MKYQNILYTTHHLIGDCGNITEYFAKNSAHFFVFSHCPTFIDEPDRLTEYVDGKKIGVREYRWYGGKSVALKYVFMWLHFAHARLFVLPRNTDVISFHPLFCFGNVFFRLVKGGRTIFWSFDFFDQYEGLYYFYNKMADFYVRHLPRVLFLGKPMRNKYAERLGARPQPEWEVLNLGTKQGNPERAPEANVLGFIGNLKDRQGLEEVMDAMVVDPSLRLDIVGMGIWLEPLKLYAAKVGVTDRVRFLGKISEVSELEKVTRRWQIGVAMYAPTQFTPYADPGKVKLYAQLGMPVLTTDITAIAPDVAELRSGVLAPLSTDGILNGIRQIQGSYETYLAGAKAMNERYEFNRTYGQAFAFLEKPQPSPKA